MWLFILGGSVLHVSRHLSFIGCTVLAITPVSLKHLW